MGKMAGQSVIGEPSRFAPLSKKQKDSGSVILHFCSAPRSVQTSKQAFDAYLVVSTPARKPDYMTENSDEGKRYPATRQCYSPHRNQK